MKEIILLKSGEMVLKGLNRSNFENRVKTNMSRRLRNLGEFKIYSAQSAFYVEPLTEDADMDAAYDALRTVFGFVSMSRALECEKDIDKITAAAISYLGDELKSAKTFKVASKRADKSFPMTSTEISQAVGGNIHEALPHLTAEMNSPDALVGVEVRETAAYVHSRAEKAAGGLPVGVSGHGMALLSGGIDSPVAAYMMARRGLSLDAVHFVSPPYTSERARDKTLRLAGLLSRYTGRMTVHIVPLTPVQEEIRRSCPEELLTILTRRFMMRIAEKIALEAGAGCLITGESLGQVASQTMAALNATGSVCTLPVFRPVIGMDKEEIIAAARRINTFETSIEPYEDCCTVFTPRHPRTRPRPAQIDEAENALDVAKLTENALLNTERVVVG